jgi:hypothetical protein
MTIITIERKLLEEVVEIFDNAISTRYPHEILRDIRAALAAPATALVVTKNEVDQIVSVTQQDGEGRIIKVIALSAPATTPECKTSGGDARAVALARLLDQAYERGVAVGLSQAVPATAPDELERLRTDAERYRWLRGDSCHDHSVRWARWEVRCWKAPFWIADLRREELDAAIDAAMKGEKP